MQINVLWAHIIDISCFMRFSGLISAVILASDDSDGKQVGFAIKPNQSMSWRGLVILYCVIATFSLAIAISFYIISLPLILPFPGLELLVLGVALYVSAWRGGNREVIRVVGDKIIIEIGRYAPEQRQEFQRYWTRLVLEHPRQRWYPSRLLGGCPRIEAVVRGSHFESVFSII